MTRSARTWLLLSFLLASIGVVGWVGSGLASRDGDPAAPASLEGAGSDVPDAIGAAPERLEGGGPGTTPPRVPEGGDRSPGGAVETDPTGTVHVRLLGVAGPEDTRSVRLTLAGADADARDVDGSGDPRHPNEGPVTFRGLPLDRSWSLWVEPRRVGAIVVPVEGPTRDRREVEVTVRLEERFALYRVRLVDEQGAPVPSQRVHLTDELRTSNARSLGSSSRVVTNTEGRVELWGSAADPGGARRAFRFELGESGTSGAPIRKGRVELPERPAPGLHDLGDVVLELQPGEVRVASGRVLDARGGPAASTKVRLHHVTGEGGGTVSGLRSVRTDAEGRFEIRGRIDTGPLAEDLERADRLYLRAHHETLGTAARAIELGDEVELRLETPGRVEGRVLPLEGVDLTRLVVVLNPAPPWGPKDEDLREGEQVPVEADGRFVLDGRPAGLYDLFLHSDSSSGELLEVLSVVVPSGTASTDPRLDGIDLAPHLVRARISVLDATGDPVVGGLWNTTKAGYVPHLVHHPYEGSTLELLLGAEPIAVALVPEGHGQVDLLSVHGDTTVRLPARRPLVLRVRVEGSFDDSSLHLRAALGSGRHGGPFPFESGDALGEHEALRFPAVTPGTYALCWRATRQPLGTFHEELVPHRPQVDVVVPPGEGPCEVEVTVRAEDLLGIR